MIKKFFLSAIAWPGRMLDHAQLYLTRLEIRDARTSGNWNRMLDLRAEEFKLLKKLYPY